jgi:hypothetical protein
VSGISHLSILYKDIFLIPEKSLTTVLTLFLGCGIHCLCSSCKGSPKMQLLLTRLIKKNLSLKNGAETDGGQGDAPLGVPPPLGERGGHSHFLYIKYKQQRTAT